LVAGVLLGLGGGGGEASTAPGARPPVAAPGRRGAVAAGLAAVAALEGAVPGARAADFVTTGSGLQYKVVKPGAGTEALTEDLVRVNYDGYLGGFPGTDTSKIFGTSQYEIATEGGTKMVKVRSPKKFTLGSQTVLPGWNEAVSGMRVGERRQVIIPPELGFGAQGGGVPSKSTLYYDLELVWNSRGGKAWPTNPFTR